MHYNYRYLSSTIIDKENGNVLSIKFWTTLHTT